jgi:ribosomal protein L7/L12
MRTEPPRTRISHLVRQAARWRPRNDRQIWLIVSSLVIVVCAEAMVIPAKRDGLACAVTGLIGMGMLVTGHRRQRRERAALASRASESRDDIPADVIRLVVAGQKIRAIKRYRELTGVELKEAKGIIDRL